MTSRRFRRMTPSSVDSAVSLAKQLHSDCSNLLELYRKKESFSSSVTVTDSRLVSAPVSSVLLNNQNKLGCLNSALVQCQALMDKAVSKEEEELGRGEMGDYEKTRKMVQERLRFLIVKTRELLKSQAGSTLITSSVGPLGMSRGVRQKQETLYKTATFSVPDKCGVSLSSVRTEVVGVPCLQRARLLGQYGHQHFTSTAQRANKEMEKMRTELKFRQGGYCDYEQQVKICCQGKRQ